MVCRFWPFLWFYDRDVFYKSMKLLLKINKQHTVIQLVVQKCMNCDSSKVTTNFLSVIMIDFTILRQICICCYSVPWMACIIKKVRVFPLDRLVTRINSSKEKALPRTENSTNELHENALRNIHEWWLSNSKLVERNDACSRTPGDRWHAMHCIPRDVKLGQRLAWMRKWSDSENKTWLIP